MNTHIDIDNIKNHFFLDFEKEEQQKVNNNIKSKIINYCFYSINEANISDIIKQIPYYANNYSIVENYDFLNIGQLNEKTIQKLSLTTNNKYLLFKYKKDYSIPFNEFLFHLNNPNVFFFYVIESFSYILNSLILLSKAGICFFNLNPENIVFNLDCGEKPFLTHFQRSLIVPKLSEEYIRNIIVKTDDYTHKPFEIHVLFYLIQTEISVLSNSFIEEISDNFIRNASFLTFFSEKYKDNYRTLCIESIKKYINKPKDFIIQDILKHSEKWDLYSVSVLYLHIFANFSKCFSLKQNSINEIILELAKNIHPEPSKRGTLQKLYENFNNIIEREKDWSFINDLDVYKMGNLFAILGE
jgi:hypothetical protein